eukprot:93433_1
MLFQNASERHRIKNKWNNQRIHKKYNQVQYASKHYWLDNDIIFKRKNPVKQRKDRKQFKTQRARKKVYKRMSFDFDDFMYRNKNENFKRIQTRPTIQRHCANNNINAIYDCYYNNHPTKKRIINDINIKQNGIISYRNYLKKSPKELNCQYRICLVCKRYVLKYKCAKILCKYCLLYLTEYTNYTDQYHQLIYRICSSCVCKLCVNDRLCVPISRTRFSESIQVSKKVKRKCEFKYCTVCEKNMFQKDKEQCYICQHFFCGKCGVNQKCINCSVKQEHSNILLIIEQYSNHILYANITHIIRKYALGFVFGCSNRLNYDKTWPNKHCLEMIVIDNFSTFSVSIDHENNSIYYYYIEDKYLPEIKDTLSYINGKYIRIFCSNCSKKPYPYTLRNCTYRNCPNKYLKWFRQPSGCFRQPGYCFNHPLCNQCYAHVFDYASPCTVCKTYLCDRCAYKDGPIDGYEYAFQYRQVYGKCRKCYYERDNKIVLELLKATLMKKYEFNILIIETIYNYYIGFCVMCGCCKQWISFTNITDVLDSQNIHEIDTKEIYTYSVARSRIYGYRKNLFVDINDDWGHHKKVFRVFCKKCTNLLTHCDKCSNYDVKPKGHEWFVCYNHCRKFYKCSSCKKYGYGCTEYDEYYDKGKSSKCKFCHQNFCRVCMTKKSHVRADELIKTIETESLLRINAVSMQLMRKNNNVKQSSRRKTKNRNKNISYWKRKSDRKGNAMSIAKWKLSNQPMNIKSIRL